MYERKDVYYRKAKAAGLRSRAAFKLDDLAEGVIRARDRVVDLGCWPGGWLQVASRRVGPRGVVVGVDRKRLDPLGLANVVFVEGDVSDPETVRAVAARLGGAADVVLSDMAPQLSGVRDRDEARAEELFVLALGVARRLLRPGGAFVCKLFMSAGAPELLAEARKSFETASTTRPAASRRGSAELYLVAQGRRRDTAGP